MTLLKSIGAILAGFIAVVVLSLVTDEVLHLLKFYPPWGAPASSGPLVVATIYRTIYSLFGSYLTARLAPNRPMFHALVGGAIGMVIAITGAMVTWNKDFGPHWYPVALVILALPTAYLGAKLYKPSAT